MDSGTGYRFHPSDFELVDHYLRHKMLGNDDEVWQIPEIQVLNFEPWELPQHSILLSNSNDQVWYFFCTPNYKYSNSKRVDRTTNAGYWKVTGKDRKIEDNIGIKKTLVFHHGRPKGVKTNWIMHECTFTFDFHSQREFVICKIKKRPDEEEDGSSSTMVAAYTENQTYNSTFQQEDTPLFGSGSQNYANEDDTQMEANMQSFQGYDEKDYRLDSIFQWRNNY
ncbi:protein NTM1-like 9 [Mercurialis annua]|uniref:protein NTM1-like 9 n=1 Tax=Mercurialis annua TaxID=3986 RepID=UPI00215FE1C2|nr:protein NTM1-like 9 [Mercurialis annua]